MSTHPSMFTRPADLSDLPQLAPLFNAYREFYEQPSDLKAAEAFIQARLERKESVVLVAQTPEGELAGFCQMYPSFCSVLAQPIYAFYDLFVSPNHRRQGVAQLLLAAAAQRGRQDGMARMDLTTAHTNTAAQALYESMGWELDRVFRAYNLNLH